jgi:hypothetical protein
MVDKNITELLSRFFKVTITPEESNVLAELCVPFA